MSILSFLRMTPGENPNNWPQDWAVNPISAVLHVPGVTTYQNSPDLVIYSTGRYEGTHGAGINTGSSTRSFLYTLPADTTTTDTLIVGFARKFRVDQQEVGEFLLLISSNGTTLGRLSINPSTYRMTVSFGNATGEVSRPTNPDQWYYIEFKIKLSNTTTGYVEVRIDGEVVYAYTGRTYTPSGTQLPVRNVSFAQRGQTNAQRQQYNTTYELGDIYIANDRGLKNNDFLGEVRVDRLLPNGPGSTSDFVGVDGNSIDNHLLLQSPNPNPASYVESNVVGARDLYTLEALPAAVEEVVAVQPRAFGSKSELGTAGLSSILKLGSNEHETNPIALGLSVTPLHTQVFEDKPGGGSWTDADVDALEIGVEVKNV